MMRLGPALGAFAISLVGHLSLARWLEDHSRYWYKNRWRFRALAFALACVGPAIRVVSIYSGNGQGISPYALIEVTMLAFAGSTVGIMKTHFWLYEKASWLVRKRLHLARHGSPALPSPEAAVAEKEVEVSKDAAPELAASDAPDDTLAKSTASKDAVPPDVPEAAKTPYETFLKEEEIRVSRRNLFERALGTTLLVGSTTSVAWGIVRGRHDFRIEEVVVKIPGLSPKLDGYTIAQISDIHVGTFVGERELEEGFSRVRAIRPDLIVATGDLVDYDSAYCDLFASELAKLRSRDGTYCIYGNHDYTTGHEAVAEALARAKVPLLVNRGQAIRAAEGGFQLLGLDEIWGMYWGKSGPNLAAAIASVRETDLPRILLSHQPRTFRELAGNCALQLSGHTHGGQINPGFRPADLVFEFVAGKYERKGSTLWVNRGFGTAGPPSRVGAPPEITKIVLVSG